MRVSARNVCVIVALAALVCVPAMAQKPQSAAGVTGEIPAQGPGVVLYDQTGLPPSGNGAPAQNFEAAFDAYDSEGADDFIVVAPGWSIESLTVVGTQSTGGAPTSVNVDFYPDNGGVPAAAPTCSYPAAPQVGSTTITVNLPAPCDLPPGPHWVAFSSNQDFGTSGQYFWSGVALGSTANSPGVWQNPNNGFGTGCTTWTQQSVCGVGGGVQDDWLFSISGVALPVELQSFDVE